MPILRLAYATLYLVAVIAVFVLWSETGGQGHLDLMPWYLKLGLGAGAAYAVVRATKAAVEGKSGWNSGSLRWTGILIALLVACGLVTYYYHLYEEGGDEDQEDSVTSGLVVPYRGEAIALTSTGSFGDRQRNSQTAGISTLSPKTRR